MVNLLEIDRLLTRRGRSVVMRRIRQTTATDGGSAIIDTQDIPVKAIVRSFKTSEIRGLVEEGDYEILVAAASLPETPFPMRDQIILNDRPATILTVATTSDSDTPIIHRLHVRG